MIIEVLSRWFHIGAAIVLVGGSVFTKFVLMPAAKGLQESEHTALRERIMGRWRKIVMAGILLLLLSGFYNYLVVALPEHKGDGFYHGIMGVKILLAFAAFFLASVLTGRSARFESLRADSGKWLGVLILITATVVALAGVLKVVGQPQFGTSSASPLQDSGSVMPRVLRGWGRGDWREHSCETDSADGFPHRSQPNRTVNARDEFPPHGICHFRSDLPPGCSNHGKIRRSPVSAGGQTTSYERAKLEARLLRA